ncbi:uncharacterized protein FIBRA_07605 [Fibroporia radiculosa]|uniref:Zn(2)-C6 fungal-type domain-containing protein n=1 Tax=Fibroporia radiculosa TaxID=599839 RepID=J4H4Q3_9APHY|nr:uncharacterized protein FIBRA_07605 [Fibroporia radiculosa]CCM05389.1 predicted protein [Fibroporia radiculosa]
MTHPANPHPTSYPSYSVRYGLNDQYHKSAYPSATPAPLPASSSQIPVKLEESPDLPPPSSSHHHPLQNPSLSLSQYYEHRASRSQDNAIFRFGSDIDSSPTSPSAAPFTFMSQAWPQSAAGSSASASSYVHPYAVDRSHPYPLPSAMNGHHAQALAISDDYDDADGDEVGDIPGSTLAGLALSAYSSGTGLAPGSAASKAEKQVRRRSSKACDQCRKSKCKCERSSPQDPCRNCVMLGTACTFLGPSRKRGPPKGYIDAIEARLHQTEALIGILLGSKDSRARGLLDDLSEDHLAREIINRVDNSPYGHKGRARGSEPATSNRTRPPPSTDSRDDSNVHASHPSTEWQDSVIARLNAVAATRNTLVDDPTSGIRYSQSPTDEASQSTRPVLNIIQPSSSSTLVGPASAVLSSASEHPTSEPPFRRQRRRLDGDEHGQRSPSTTSGRSHSPAVANPPSARSVSGSRAFLGHRGSVASLADTSARSPEMHDDEGYAQRDDPDVVGGEDELAIEVGQLSLNEDEQVRFHGKVSGLHLLGVKDREDERHEGGIWRFPKARVWPPLPPSASNQAKGMENFTPFLPDQATQELLLDLYWTYVHPALPIVQKWTFMEDFRSGGALSADSPYSEASDSASPGPSSRKRRVPTLLLLAMFSIAARYSSATSSDVPPPQEGSIWTAGERYLEDAKVILDSSYAASRPSTCQALLLMGYREVGIGAMAQAWLYIGMAVRMAQDLGLHKSAEKWSSVGRTLFNGTELQERRRIWYGCVVMDKYVSAYIGRPVTVFERDFDTELPIVDGSEEPDLWSPHPSAPLLDDSVEPNFPAVTPVACRVVSCFSESAKLSIILSMIMQGLYAIKPKCYRQAEFSRHEELLSKWYLDLPDHLRFDPAAPKSPAPLPHVLTLHMQYWCTVLLLHRPFIRHLASDSSSRPLSSSSKDSDMRANSRQNYDICVQAANHITSIVSVYVENYTAKRASVYLCYYVFTAAVMHVSTLMAYPDDAQARVCLNKCMDVLKRMRILWGSAWRALELLQGSKVNTQHAQDTVAALRPRVSDRNKRSAEHSLDQQADDNARMLANEQLYRAPPGLPAPSPVHQSFAMNSLQMVPAESPTFHSYDRWTSEASLPSYGANLSTSVLPQQYSTGLVDERLSSGISRHSERQSQRYPQYWNDYSSLGQMDTSYGVPVIGDMVAHHASGTHSDQPSMYVQDYANIFGNIPPNHQ